MRIRWKRILFQLLCFELLAVEPIKLLAKGLYSSKAQMRKGLVAWAIKAGVSLVLLWTFVHCALLFGLAGLALYLNALLGSSYQGFLLVSGGCTTFLLLFWLLSRVR